MCEASRDSKHCTLKLVPFPEHTFSSLPLGRGRTWGQPHTEKLLHSVIILISLVYCNQSRDQETNNLAQKLHRTFKEQQFPYLPFALALKALTFYYRL